MERTKYVIYWADEGQDDMREIDYIFSFSAGDAALKAFTRMVDLAVSRGEGLLASLKKFEGCTITAKKCSTGEMSVFHGKDFL